MGKFCLSSDVPHVFCPLMEHDLFMGSGLSMTARGEITRKFAPAHAGASKRDNSRLLGGVCGNDGPPWHQHGEKHVARILLRNSITVRSAGDEVEGIPGFFEGDTVTKWRIAVPYSKVSFPARPRSHSGGLGPSNRGEEQSLGAPLWLLLAV